jgi:hypothetical protein
MSDARFIWPDLSLGLAPIVVGVTGHRFLREEDVDNLQGKVREVFARLRKDFPHSPLLLLTPLAEGADQLVARVAVEAGARLVIAIPFPLDEYRRSFQPEPSPETEEEKARDRRSQAALADFDRWWNDTEIVDRRIVMPAIADLPHETPLDAETRRNLQYALVGAFVSRHSHFLIALWDGAESGKIGGADNVVEYRRSGRYPFERRLQRYLEDLPEPYALPSGALEPGPTGPVFHIVTPREGEEPPARAFDQVDLAPLIYYRDLERKEPNAAAARYFKRIREIYGRIDEFNKDASAQVNRRRAQAEASREDIYSESEESIPATLANLGNCFALADSLAVRHRRITYWMLAAMILTVFAAAVPFAAYAHLVSDEEWKWWALALYAVLLGVADGLYLLLRRFDSQNKFQDYRALGEGLRAQFYWLLAGLPHSVADHYLHKQKDELRWIRTAIGGWSLRAEPVAEGHLGAVCRLWLLPQGEYFKGAMVRERGHLAACNGLGASLILVSVAGALGQIVLHRHGTLPDFVVLAVATVFGLHAVYVARDNVREAEDSGWEMALTSARWFVPGAILAAVIIEALVCMAAPDQCWVLPHLPLWMQQWCLGHLGEHLKTHFFFRRFVMDAHGWLVAGLGLAALAGALVHTYAEKRAFSQHFHQYKRMQETYSRAGDEMAALLRSRDLQRASEVLVDLGKEALAEQGDWVILHRERPIDLPQAEG